jgi:hypothetical protein
VVQHHKRRKTNPPSQKGRNGRSGHLRGSGKANATKAASGTHHHLSFWEQALKRLLPFA